MATVMGSKLQEQVKRFEKAAKLTEAVRRQTEANRSISAIAAAGRTLKAQLPPKQ